MLFGTNWKMMSGNRVSALLYAATVLHEARDLEDPPRLFIMPPYTVLRDMAEVLRGSSIRVGAQNCHWAPHGEVTGELSVEMVSETGAALVLVGHAERRRLFGETDEEVNRKVHAVLSHDLGVVLCVGDSAEQRRSGTGAESVSQSLGRALKGVDPEHFDRLVIAYEPEWAIGTDGEPARTAEVESGVQALRSCLEGLAGVQARSIPILYGGNVNESNCEQLAGDTSVDGLFIGRAALDPLRFMSISRRAQKARVGSAGQ